MKRRAHLTFSNPQDFQTNQAKSAPSFLFVEGLGGNEFRFSIWGQPEDSYIPMCFVGSVPSNMFHDFWNGTVFSRNKEHMEFLCQIWGFHQVTPETVDFETRMDLDLGPIIWS